MKITIDEIKIRPVSERRTANSRVYVFFNDDDQSIQWCNAVKDLKEQVMPKVLKYMGLPTKTQFRWDALAGCQCGCSPGFIVKDGAGVDSSEVFVDARVVKA